jgi:hypothetical protein
MQGRYLALPGTTAVTRVCCSIVVLGLVLVKQNRTLDPEARTPVGNCKSVNTEYRLVGGRCWRGTVP